MAGFLLCCEYAWFACIHMCVFTWSPFCLTRHALYLNSEPAYMGSSSEIPSLYFLSEQGISEEPPWLLANCVGAGDLNLGPPHSCTASTSSPVSSTQLSLWWTKCLMYVLFTLPIHPLTDSCFVSTSWLLYIKSKGVKWSLQNLIFFLFTYIATSWTVRSYEILLPINLRYM